MADVKQNQLICYSDQIAIIQRAVIVHVWQFRRRFPPLPRAYQSPRLKGEVKQQQINKDSVPRVQ